jgi:hypothetical protein
MENCFLFKPTIHFSFIPQYVLGAYWFTLGPEIRKWGTLLDFGEMVLERFWILLLVVSYQ